MASFRVSTGEYPLTATAPFVVEVSLALVSQENMATQLRQPFLQGFATFFILSSLFQFCTLRLFAYHDVRSDADDDELRRFIFSCEVPPIELFALLVAYRRNFFGEFSNLTPICWFRNKNNMHCNVLLG